MVERVLSSSAKIRLSWSIFAIILSMSTVMLALLCGIDTFCIPESSEQALSLLGVAEGNS